jgi:hypothetical protein
LKPPVEAPPVDVYVSGIDGISRIAAHSGDITVVTAAGRNNVSIAVDSLENVFVRHFGPGVDKYPSGGGAPVYIAGDGDPRLSMIDGLAADPLGNVYAISWDGDQSYLFKILPGGQPAVIWSRSWAEGSVWNTAVDSHQNAYLQTNGSVIKVAPRGAQPAVIDVSGFIHGVIGLAVDPQGNNLYFTTFDRPPPDPEQRESLMKVPLNGDPPTTITVWSGAAAHYVAADANGNVYTTNYLDDRVDMFDSSGRQAMIGQIASPLGVAVPPPRTVIALPVPLRRSRLPELIGKMFGGAAVDGGGWIVIGNTVIPIPLRSPVMTTLVGVAMPFVDRAIEAPELAEQLRNLKEQS